MGGRRPQPTAVKLLHGNPGKRPLNEQEPSPELSMPEMPKGMGHIANREWKWLGPALLEIGCLSRVDGKSFAEYCKAVAMSEIYYKVALAEPMVAEPIMSKAGEHVGDKIKANPAMAAYVAASKLAKTYLTEFGLTPASRSKLKVEKPKDADPFEAAMAKRTPQPAITESQSPVPQQSTYFDIGKAVAGADVSFDA